MTKKTIRIYRKDPTEGEVIENVKLDCPPSSINLLLSDAIELAIHTVKPSRVEMIYKEDRDTELLQLEMLGDGQASATLVCTEDELRATTVIKEKQ